MKKPPAFYVASLAIGDCICATPTIRKISEIYGTKVKVFTHFPEIFAALPYVSESVDCKIHFAPELMDSVKRDYDLHSSFTNLGRKVKLSDERGIEMKHSMMDIRQYHAIDNGFMLKADEMHCDFVPLSDVTKFDLPVNYVVLHPFKNWPSRTWDNKNWEDLIKKLLEAKIPVVVIGKDKLDEKLLKHLQDETKLYPDNTAIDRVFKEMEERKVASIDIDGLIDLTNQTSLSQAWNIINGALCVVTMDSGILHLAGTTDTHIIQLGSSIDPEFRAPYRKGSQKYKYSYVGGSCGIFCASNLKYSLRDWEFGYNGSTPLQSVPLIDTCLENKKTFECHPSAEQTFNIVKRFYKIQSCESCNGTGTCLALKGAIVPPYGWQCPECREYRESGGESGKVMPKFLGEEFPLKNDITSNEPFHPKKGIAERWGNADSIKSSSLQMSEEFTKNLSIDAAEEISKILLQEISPMLIKIESGSLGDTIGALAVIDAYSKGAGIGVISKLGEETFGKSYPNIMFFPHESEPEFKVTTGTYELKGRCFKDFKRIYYKFEDPLMEGYAKQLGVTEWNRPRIDVKLEERPIKNKYVCFSMHSTAQAKHWNYPNGWDILCRMLRKEGITPVCIDRHEKFGVDHWWNEVPTAAVKKQNMHLDQMTNFIHHSEFFIGISSGLSWVAHAIGKPVVMISGVTSLDNEFTENTYRLINEKVCHGCINKPDENPFDSGDWLWCPINRDTDKQFECTKTITPEEVFAVIKQNLL